MDIHVHVSATAVVAKYCLEYDQRLRPTNPQNMQIWTLKEKSPEKPGDWDLKPGYFQNMK